MPVSCGIICVCFWLFPLFLYSDAREGRRPRRFTAPAGALAPLADPHSRRLCRALFVLLLFGRLPVRRCALRCSVRTIYLRTILCSYDRLFCSLRVDSLQQGTHFSLLPTTHIIACVLHSRLRHPAVSFYACRAAFPAQHVRPSGVLSCWPDCLELTPRFYPGSDEQQRGLTKI